MALARGMTEMQSEISGFPKIAIFNYGMKL
jgi:hypothetical protein